MSDPVSNIEIEDVLSSIRRLVSEETGSQPRPDPVRPPAPESRLVLTPALRVPDDVADLPVPVESKIDSADKTNLTAGESIPWSKPDSTLYMAAQIEPEPRSSEPDNVASEGEALLLRTSADVHEAAADTDGVLAPTSEVDVMTVAVLQQPEKDVAPAPVVVDVVEPPIPEVEPEWPGKEIPAQRQAAGVEDCDVQQDDLQAPGDPAVHADTPSNDLPVDALTPLSAKIEALETAIGETQDQWEPDGTAGDDYAEAPVKMLRWQDHQPESPVSAEDNTDAEVVQETRAETIAPETSAAAEPDLDTDDDDANALDFLVGDDSLMDEESLRELVADIVREELQGALGERITRNVRKLVRREIQRALTTQQLD